MPINLPIFEKKFTFLSTSSPLSICHFMNKSTPSSPQTPKLNNFQISPIYLILFYFPPNMKNFQYPQNFQNLKN